MADQFVHTGPEAHLGISWSMAQTGDMCWFQPASEALTDGLGRFSSGSLAVLADSAFGSENHVRRPAGTWTVTTELRLDVHRGPRPDSTGLTVAQSFLGGDGRTLVTRGEILDDDGAPVALSIVRSIEVPGPEIDLMPEVPWEPCLLAGTLDEVLAMTCRRIDDRTAEVELAPEKRLANPLGNLHGGVFAAAAETAGAALFPHEREISSTTLDVRYIRQIPLTGPVTIRAEAAHNGRSWGIARVSTLDERGRACAVATVTVYGARRE